MNPPFGYTSQMTKRLVDIDDALLERARSVAGVGTIKATVAMALQRLVDQDLALHHVERLRKPGALNLDLIEQARTPEAAADG